ncbi:hypothetical protein OIU85_025751 [Salix viminalis]|uniref:BZIP domain-containing protein n=1 Tax=Salix viminalis TaxID=40686 RepID=A0A9Q0TM25_SALVM|nr:hypothetical protein OIU85_025751 [Salix viminalis]
MESIQYSYSYQHTRAQPRVVPISISRLMSARTDLHTQEMKNRKKREADRRHRQNKKIAVQETENKLAITITENESLKRAVEELRQEIFHLTSQRELTEQRIAVQETENKLAMTIIENESLKRAVEELRQEIYPSYKAPARVD